MAASARGTAATKWRASVGGVARAPSLQREGDREVVASAIAGRERVLDRPADQRVGEPEPVGAGVVDEPGARPPAPGRRTPLRGRWPPRPRPPTARTTVRRRRPARGRCASRRAAGPRGRRRPPGRSRGWSPRRATRPPSSGRRRRRTWPESTSCAPQLAEQEGIAVGVRLEVRDQRPQLARRRPGRRAPRGRRGRRRGRSLRGAPARRRDAGAARAATRAAAR